MAAVLSTDTPGRSAVSRITATGLTQSPLCGGVRIATMRYDLPTRGVAVRNLVCPPAEHRFALCQVACACCSVVGKTMTKPLVSVCLWLSVQACGALDA